MWRIPVEGQDDMVSYLRRCFLTQVTVIYSCIFFAELYSFWSYTQVCGPF